MPVKTTQTLQEILNQPEAWRRTLEAATADRLPSLPLDQAEHIYLVGSGSSYYLSMMLASRLRARTRAAVEAVPSVELLLHPESYYRAGRAYLTVLVSRSGTSTEAVRAAQWLKESGRSATLALSCTPGSPMVELAEQALVAPVQEESVVMTQSFTSMALLFEAAVQHALEQAAPGPRPEGVVGLEPFRRQALQWAEGCAAALEACREPLEDLAGRLELDHLVLLGSGLRYGAAREGALKLHEMALARTEAYHTLEYRHGPKSTASRRTLAITLLGPGEEAWLAPLAAELHPLVGAQLLLGAWSSDQVPPGSTVLAPDPAGDELGDALLMLVLLQYLAERRAVAQGLNPDAPRNLSKVVLLDP